MAVEEGKKSFGERVRGRRVFVGVFEDVVEELVGEGREVIDLRRKLRRTRKSADRDHGETQGAYKIQVQSY